MRSHSVEIVGVLNVTPDSFSDGGRYLESDAIEAQLNRLISGGASVIDVGADSTRPGSTCVGPDVELERLNPLFRLLRQSSGNFDSAVKFSVDTHHAKVAQVAIQSGFQMVNDISAGHDPEMFSLLKEFPDVKYVMMYSRCNPPHHFQSREEGDIVQNIVQFFSRRIDAALSVGVRLEQLVLDPGMGGFISDDPRDSWEVIRRFHEFLSFKLPLYFGSSRKGFLKLPREKSLLERDILTAYTSHLVRFSVRDAVPLYIRTHRPDLFRSELCWEEFLPKI